MAVRCRGDGRIARVAMALHKGRCPNLLKLELYANAIDAAAVATKDGSTFCLATARMTSCAKDGSSLLAMATSAGTPRQNQ